ncbi:MAG: TA system antitoxin ParD family protein, partial [Brachymonas sp.]
AFNSVKLPAPLVNEARAAALTFRRSTAGQIEYWAMLGKAVEESGITVREVQAVMEPVEAAPTQAQSLISQFVAFDRSGGLAEHVRKVVANNAAQAKNRAKTSANQSRHRLAA